METRTVQRLLGAGAAFCNVGFIAIAVGVSYQGEPLSKYWIYAVMVLTFGVQAMYLLVYKPDRERSKAWCVGQTTGGVILFVLGILLLYIAVLERRQAFL
jgi:hypothetical protein